MLLNVTFLHVDGFAGKEISEEEDTHSLTPSSALRLEAVWMSSYECS
jgi:hypothetical protein